MKSKPVSSTPLWALLEFLPWVLALNSLHGRLQAAWWNKPSPFQVALGHDGLWQQQEARQSRSSLLRILFYLLWNPLPVFKAGHSMKFCLYCVRNLGERSLPPVPAQCLECKRCQKGTEPLEMKSVFTDKVIAYLRTRWWEYFPFLV